MCVLVSLGTPARGAPSHVRLETRHHGAIHVWTPDGYDREHAGLVIYVHGYFADVDDAWREYKLADQFAASRRNALFIACEAPVGPRDDVTWPSLRELLAYVAEQLDEPLPEVVLLDALYGEVDELRTWIEASPDRRLIDVGEITRPWTDDLHAQLPETVTFDGFPRLEGKLPRARKSRIVYVRSQLGHMPLVTGGVALPLVLRMLRLPRVTVPEAAE